MRNTNERDAERPGNLGNLSRGNLARDAAGDTERDTAGRRLTKLPAVLMVMLTAGIGWTGEARAQPRCGPLGPMEEVLRKSYQEERIGYGLVNRTTVLLFYASPEGRTFSILAVNRQGLACPVAGGTDLELAPALPGKES